MKASAAAIVIGVMALSAGCGIVNPRGTLVVRVMDWPGCNVDIDPPNVCAPRNVANALVVAMMPRSGEVIADGRTNHDGRVFLEVPPGEYLIAGHRIAGLITPEPLLLEVPRGGSSLETALHYQSGIRVDSDGHP